MLQRTAYKFRTYPDPEQASLFRRTAGCCRLVYNLCLEQRRLEWHRSVPRRLTAAGQMNELKDLKAAAPFLKQVPHHPLQQAIRDLDRAFRTSSRDARHTQNRARSSGTPRSAIPIRCRSSWIGMGRGSSCQRQDGFRCACTGRSSVTSRTSPSPKPAAGGSYRSRLNRRSPNQPKRMGQRSASTLGSSTPSRRAMARSSTCRASARKSTAAGCRPEDNRSPQKGFTQPLQGDPAASPDPGASRAPEG